MERTVAQIQFPAAPLPRLTRVAAYARVSSGKDAMLHSLSAQVSYYSDMIQKHPGWQYAGVYADEAITGTKDAREGFQRLLAACRAGEVDMVITKSISRLARNTVTLLGTVRELKGLGVDVFFEEQNIHTMSADGELMMTILASYAQEESRSASENQLWRIRRNFEAGQPWVGNMLGYRLRDGEYKIIPEEAEVVKRIFSDYLSGMGHAAICKALNEDGITTKDGYPWRVGTVMKVLSNYCYTGNLLLQKKYRENHITKRTLDNHGEKPMYHVEGFHEAIIPMEVYQAVQEERARRAQRFGNPHPPSVASPFTGMITCGCCGAKYNRRTANGKKLWICRTYSTLGKSACPESKAVPEDVLTALADQVASLGEITAIRAERDNTLVFTLADGSEIVKRWQDRSRSESWTDEMREQARRKTIERNRSHA